LLIGTNDYGQGNGAGATNRLEALIAQMALARPYAKIIVANLTQRGEPQNTQIQTTFNPFIPGIVAAQQALGREVYFTDLYNTVPLSDMPDNLHPNLTGYTKMATNWFSNITNLFSPLGSTNAPVLSRAILQTNLTNVVVTFSKPVADDAITLTNYSISGGIPVLDAVLDPVSLRDVTLTTPPMATETLYTLTVDNVRDRTAAQTPIASNSTIDIYVYGGLAGRGVFDNVPEAADYTLVYSLDIPDAPSYPVGTGYDLDLSAYTPPFSRVAYYLELQTGYDPADFVWVSMDAMTSDPNTIGVPTVSSGAVYQQDVTNMNVQSSVVTVTPGTNLSGGNLEFWPGNYEQNNTAGVPNADSSTFDFGDNPTPGNYGSMQVHNHGAGEVLLAFNRWGGVGGTADLGIGSSSGSNPDWTFAQNASFYAVKQLQVFVLPTANTHPPVLVGAEGQGNLTSVILSFSKALDDSATNITLYALDGGVTVVGAALDPLNKLSVTLTTSPLTPTTVYTVTVNGVKDRTPAQLTIAPNSTAVFVVSPEPPQAQTGDPNLFTPATTVTVNSTYPNAAFDSQNLVDGGIASHVFAEGNVNQRYALSGFSAPDGIAMLRFFDEPQFSERIMIDVTVYYSTNDHSGQSTAFQLNTANYLGGTFYDMPSIAGVNDLNTEDYFQIATNPEEFSMTYGSPSARAIHYADIAVGLPAGTRSILLLATPSAISGQGAGLTEIQAFVPATPILLSPQIIGSNLQLAWTAELNTTYRLEYTGDLNPPNWIAVPGDVTGVSATASKTDALTSTNRFYRVRVSP